MKPETSRDPFDYALAEVLDELIKGLEYGGEARLIRASGVPRSSLQHYRDGSRPIRVDALRKIAIALDKPVAEFFAEAERRIE